MDGDLRKRLLRAGIILLLGWMVLEIALVRIAADRFGWGQVLLAMTLKGGLGLAMLFALTLRGLVRLRIYARGHSDLDAVVGPAFGVASAVLIAFPGFLPALIGLALFTPALRGWCIRVISSVFDPPDPSVTDRAADGTVGKDNAGEAAASPADRTDGVARPDRAPSLETRPPSV